MNYQDLTPRERITRVHLDLLSDPEYSRIGPATQIGAVHCVDDIPTAKTDGLDVWYSNAWVMKLSREQLRYVVAHENLHRLLQHCTLYKKEFSAYPEEAAQAVDFCVNLLVEDMDKARRFVHRPTDIPPLVDDRYRGMNCLEVLADLVRNRDPNAPPPLDKHEQREAQPGEDELLDDARVQGEITSARLRGVGAGSASLGGFEKVQTNWIDPLRQFMQENMEGDEQSRWCPPNRIFRPLGIMLPSHYSEAAGDLVVACDTSGSMHPYYARVFGEIGRLCEQVQPKSVTVLWWDTRVSSVQTFGPGDYLQMTSKLKATGGGGTTVSVVAQYMREHKMKPKATIMLTDGYVEPRFECPDGPLLWGVIGHASFSPSRGKVLRIGKESL